MAMTALPLEEPYALGATLSSGQSFRWRSRGSCYSGFIGHRPAVLRMEGRSIVVETKGSHPAEDAATSYLRLQDPMRSICRAIATDRPMELAVRRWRGLHLLAQDPWETTASFIASSASNIPRISRSIESLCTRFGRRAEAPWGAVRLFPSPAAVARASTAELRACGLGYRAAYLRSAARAVQTGAVDLDALRAETTDRAREQLVEGLDGVGPKVADCVLLFSLGKDDAFPVDRWVQRRVADLYHGGAIMAPGKVSAWGRQRWGPWAGYAQQYLFHDGRTRASRRSAARSRPRSPSP